MALTLHFFPSCRRREERGTLASQPIRARLLAIAKLLTPESSKAASASSAFNLPRIFLRFLPNAYRSWRSHREQPPIREESMTFYLPNIVKMLEDPCAAWRLLFLGTQVSSLYCYNSFSRTGFFFASADGTAQPGAPSARASPPRSEFSAHVVLRQSRLLRLRAPPHRSPPGRVIWLLPASSALLLALPPLLSSRCCCSPRFHPQPLSSFREAFFTPRTTLLGFETIHLPFASLEEGRNRTQSAYLSSQHNVTQRVIKKNTCSESKSFTSLILRFS
nr:uncharacterized protein LOC131752931 [Kogia breviceps]